MGHHGPAISTIAIQVSNADISDFQHLEMPANTAIADVSDVPDFWATMGRQFSISAVQMNNANISEFHQREMPANTAIVDFPIFRFLGNHGPAIYKYCHPGNVGTAQVDDNS